MIYKNPLRSSNHCSYLEGGLALMILKSFRKDLKKNQLFLRFRIIKIYLTTDCLALKKFNKQKRVTWKNTFLMVKNLNFISIIMSPIKTFRRLLIDDIVSKYFGREMHIWNQSSSSILHTNLQSLKPKI